MLDWLIGSTRSGDDQVLNHGMRRTSIQPSVFSLGQGDSETFLEDPPETPAPMFAVRAFKSAIFGTPHPAQPAPPSNRSRKVSNHASSPKASAVVPEPLKAVIRDPRNREDTPRKLDLDALGSPTKGILLTPGMGPTRRKNVTFRGLSSDEKSKAKDSTRTIESGGTSLEASLSQSQSAGPIDNQPQQTSLTKALYKAKNGVSSGNARPSSTVSFSNRGAGLALEKGPPTVVTEKDGRHPDVAADMTIDLSHPHSRSGKHWKAEFEQYHKKSDREMKKIILVSRNVKSFAAQKDTEASELSEKLQQERSRVAMMEGKVTDLAMQLAATRTHDTEETPDQTKLVNDLARQTALAIRYKQKADNYEVALMKKNTILAPDTDGSGDVIPQDSGVEMDQHRLDSTMTGRRSQEIAVLRAELGRFRNSAEVAEQKAAKLETENLALQAEIDKLREQMKKSELKRQAREESFQRREDAFKASKADYDAQLLNLLSKNEALLQDVQHHHKSQPAHEHEISKEQWKTSSNKIPGAHLAASQVHGSHDHLKPRKHANTHSPESSMVDIWALGGQDSTLPLEKTPNKKDPAEYLPKALQTIAENLVREDENRLPSNKTQSSALLMENRTLSKSQTAYNDVAPLIPTSAEKLQNSAAKRTAPRWANVGSPSPPTLTLGSSPPKPLSSTQHHAQRSANSAPQHQTEASLRAISKIESTPNQAAKLISVAALQTQAGVGRKESEMPGPVDRKEAMRARMAERMAEKRKVRGDRGKGG
jgi:regulator of replication initiation timing